MLFLGFYITFTLSVFGQSNEKKWKIEPQWKLGDTKSVRVEYTSQLYFDDSLIEQKSTVYNTLMKVIAIDDYFTVSWICKNDQEIRVFDTLTTSNTEANAYSNQLLKEAEREILHSVLQLQVDKRTGQVLEWSNGREKLKNTGHTKKKELRKWCESNAVSDTLRIELEYYFNKRIENAYEIWREKLLQNANNILAPYTLGFKLNHTTVEDVQTKDVLQTSDTTLVFPGKRTTDAVEVNGKLMVDAKLVHNNDTITQYLRKSISNMETLEKNEVEVYETEHNLFDMNSTWLINSEKELYFKVKGMKKKTRSSITLM